MSKSKCETCKSNARYDLDLVDKIVCDHCGFVMYDKMKLLLCKLQCPNLYWMQENHQFNKDNDTITVSYFIEKEECNNCGNRNYLSATFAGSVRNTICDCCEKNARYKLKLKHLIHCYSCRKVKYNKQLKLSLCSTQCNNVPWKPVEYLTKANNDDIELIYRIKDDPCLKCKEINDSIGVFYGNKIM